MIGRMARMNRKRLPTVLSMLEDQVRQEKMRALLTKGKQTASREQKAYARTEKLRRIKVGKRPAENPAFSQQEKVRKETFGMADATPAMPKQPMDVRAREVALVLPIRDASDSKAKAKRTPHLISAIIAASVLTLVVALSLSVIFQTTLLFTLGISAPVFFGLGILFYNYLEAIA